MDGEEGPRQAATGPCLLDFLLYDRARATRIQTSDSQERHRAESPRAQIAPQKKSAVLMGTARLLPIQLRRVPLDALLRYAYAVTTCQ